MPPRVLSSAACCRTRPPPTPTDDWHSAERDAADGQPVAPGQRDDLVGLPGVRVAGDLVVTAVDRARAHERDVGEPCAPDHLVVEVAVAVVLELVVRVVLGLVVPGAARPRDRGTRVQLD